jgi:hypothetical protein
MNTKERKEGEKIQANGFDAWGTIENPGKTPSVTVLVDAALRAMIREN